ncbi:hypothetical protein [Sphingomonas albertensis]|uniref:hypothetical protein n=1 Tax=Sphingomonas albertensis TaxID=2762591 RepID=UPI0037D9B953
MNCYINDLGRGECDGKIRDLTQRVESLETYGNNALAIIAEGAVPGPPGSQGDDGDKGDPGGNAMAVGLFTNISSLSIPAGFDLIQTSGHHIVGVGPAQYIRVAANPGLLGAGQVQDATGQWWRIFLPAGLAYIEQFGGAGDGVSTSVAAFTLSSGTFNDQPLKDAIAALTTGDYGPNYLMGPTIVFGNGNYRFAESIEIKKGVHLRGNCAGIQQIVWQTRLFFPAGSNGITTHTFQTLGNGLDPGSAPLKGSTGVLIHGICVVSADAGLVGGTYGFRQRSSAAWDYCVSIGFGDGFVCSASTGSTPEFVGNCNGWRANFCIARDTFRHGLYVIGTDANGGVSIHFQAMANIGGCGIFDASSLGNKHIAPQIDSFNRNGKGRASAVTTTATFVATIAGVTMTVSSVSSGAIQAGQTVAGVTVVGPVAGANGLAGTYTLSADPGVTSATTSTQNLDYMFVGTQLVWATQFNPTTPNIQAIWYPIGPASDVYPAWSASNTYEWSMPICVIGANNRTVVSGYYTEGGLSHGGTVSYFIPGQGSITNLTPQPLNSNLYGTLAPGNSLGTQFRVNFGNNPAIGLVYSCQMPIDGNWNYQHRMLRRDLVWTIEQDSTYLPLRLTGKMTERTFGTKVTHPGYAVAGKFALGSGDGSFERRFRYTTTAALLSGSFAQGEWALTQAPALGGAVANVATTGGTIASGAWAPSTAYSTVGNSYTNGGSTYVLTRAGTSAASGGPTGTGSQIVDGTAMWAYESATFVLGSVYAPATGSATAYDPPSIAAGASVTTTVTVQGALVGDRVTFTLSVDEGLLYVRGRVTATNVVTMRYTNLTAAAIDMAAHNINVSCTRA